MPGYAQPALTSEGRLSDGVTLVEKPFSEVGFRSKLRSVLDTPTAV